MGQTSGYYCINHATFAATVAALNSHMAALPVAAHNIVSVTQATGTVV